MTRTLRLLLVLAAAGALIPARAADVEFVRVWPGWRDAAYFSRISEYFTDRENTSGRIVLRSHPDVRAGFYFLARVKHPGVALAPAKFVLRVITAADPAPKVYDFPIARPPGEDVFELGLTGRDWPDHSIHPVAWQLELLGADGRRLAAEQSFLWAKPEK